ncbi:MAG: hypothetical protein RL736_54 [Pseudomonadota bacterium]|jgi:hypothetical protein
MANLKPFRDYDEHDVINLFAYSGASANKGTVVTVNGNGVNLLDATSLDNLSSYGNTVSAQYNVPWSVGPAVSGASKGAIVGMLLKDVRTVDENGEKLIFNPRKAAEMDVIVSGQAVPILTKGIVLVSGIVGTPGFGSGAAVSDAGGGDLKVVAYSASTATVGKFLGPTGSDGFALLKIEL